MPIREKKSSEVRKKIMEVAGELILANGYKKTTIRQITEKAGINIGTLYHFFRDKEDIFLHLAAKAYSSTIDAGDSIREYRRDPIPKYVLSRVLELKAAEKYPRVAEMLLDVYGSARITQRVVPLDVERYKSLFHAHNRNFTYQDYYVRTLALRGIRASLVADRLQSGEGHFDERWPFLVESELLLFNVPRPEIAGTIQKIRKVINKKMITISGFSI